MRPQSSLYPHVGNGYRWLSHARLQRIVNLLAYSRSSDGPHVRTTRFEFKKRSQLFIRTHNELLFIAEAPLCRKSMTV